MNPRRPLLIALITLFMSITTFSQSAEKEVLKIVNDFFHTMETKDSTAFNALFVENAHAYSIRQQRDSTLVRNSILKASSSENVLKERLREEEITFQINKNIAAVSAPYDFWINGKHSHCGYEIFTLIKKDQDWKIATLTYSVEKDSCN